MRVMDLATNFSVHCSAPSSFAVLELVLRHAPEVSVSVARAEQHELAAVVDGVPDGGADEVDAFLRHQPRDAHLHDWNCSTCQDARVPAA